MNIDADILRKSTVMVVGCGALGNEVLKNLLLMGVGHFIIVDFDCVESSNLTRSVLFRRNDVGKRKVDAARNMLLEINPLADVKSIFGDIAYDVGLGVMAAADVVVGCVDSRWARYCIQRHCLRLGKTWVDGGILELEGTARVFIPQHSCYACFLGPHGLQELRQRVPCSGLIRRKEEANHAPTTPIAASVIGAVQAQLAVKTLIGTVNEDAGKMFYFDGEHLTARNVMFEAWDDDCELHDDSYLPAEESNIDSNSTVDELLTYGTLPLPDPFVDFLVNSVTGQRTEVMLPARKIADFVEDNAALQVFPPGVFRTHEYYEISSDFPYRHMSINKLGIPENDILKFRTKGGYRCILMK